MKRSHFEGYLQKFFSVAPINRTPSSFPFFSIKQKREAFACRCLFLSQMDEIFSQLSFAFISCRFYFSNVINDPRHNALARVISLQMIFVYDGFRWITWFSMVRRFLIFFLLGNQLDIAFSALIFHAFMIFRFNSNTSSLVQVKQTTIITECITSNEFSTRTPSFWFSSVFFVRLHHICIPYNALIIDVDWLDLIERVKRHLINSQAIFDTFYMNVPSNDNKLLISQHLCK